MRYLLAIIIILFIQKFSAASELSTAKNANVGAVEHVLKEYLEETSFNNEQQIAKEINPSEAIKPSVFHRLLILNERSEIMLVKIKNSERWVTPGWYQDNKTDIQTGLNVLAASYGIAITPPILRGVFTLSGPQEHAMSTRLVYVTHLKSGTLTLPEMIQEVRWVTSQEAESVLTFPHISNQIRQIVQYPNTLWGGAQAMVHKDGVYGVKTLIDFYPLNPTK